ncbi:hypothetical protein C8F04DRAFT_1089730 [Mycena alexandri]|uniref:PHD-type domain-containing protein n=1 Tax=Mycena alexandri TaxID=1745969 RepID=A0AAD6X683_9AGAR|nr:hypothetical protein C8F04DRAFT_1089730 [Mycena alexandri]
MATSWMRLILLSTTSMSRRLDISSLLCDEPPPKDPPRDTRRTDQVVAETVVLAPHLVRNPNPAPRYDPPPPEQPLDTLARAAALAEKQHRDRRPEPPFTRSPADDHRIRAVPHFSAPRHVLEQQQQQHQHHLRLLQQHREQQLQQEALNARQREHHEQMIQQERMQLQAQMWDREQRERGRVDAMALPIELRPGRKSDPGQMRPLTSPAPCRPSPPPNKKRRYSDSPGPLWPERTSSLTRTGERSILNPEPEFPRSAAAPRRAPPVMKPLHSAFPTASAGTAAPASNTTGRGRRSPPGSLPGRKAARKSEPDEPDVIPYAPERRDYNTTIIHLPEREIEEHVVEDNRKHRKTHSQGQPHPLSLAGPSRRPEPQQQQQQQLHQPDPRSHGPPQRRPQPAQPPPPPPPRQPKEEDAHEWLLEHFADPSPDAQARRKLDPPISPSPVPVPTNTKRVTSPLAAVALEQELATVHVPAGSKMDVDVAVSALEEGGMEVDVEDELLSLVDDRPRVSRVPSVPASSPSFMSPARGSMPPPASTAAGQSKKEPAPRKKKDAATTAKAPPKPKATTPAAAKPRARPAPKPKAKPSDGATGSAAKAKAPSAISRKSGSAAASASRSRSTSVMPGGSVGPDGSEKPEDEEEEAALVAAEDDKLYCVCKTKYDEDRFMIACDKCDEWYHTQCVDMPDLVVNLVDQFFCPICIEKNPNLSLKTTYKQRCRYGLDHPEPDSPKACHKPAQGAFSKYCSPECGLNNIKKRIDTFAKNGGKKELLWDSVKDAEKREAVVIVHDAGGVAVNGLGADGCNLKENGGAGEKLLPVPVVVATPRVKPPGMGKVERETANLNAALEEVVTLHDDLKEGMDIVLWRERLLELASERAEQVGQCGWDQRLCFGEDEWAEFGAGVLESYEDAREDGMQVDAEEWWCVEGEKCARHAGWQAIRGKDIAKEKEKKEEALYKLTTRERELRKRIEDIVEPFNRSKCLDPALQSSKLVNGNAKGKTNGDAKKGKKRKNPS